jgi:hypothetical protein
VKAESRPFRRLRDDDDRNRSPVGGQRAWARDVRELADEDLLACVRAQVSVERAVDRYRRPRRAHRGPVRFEVPA